tara:strand:- start:363 stop:2501 length:2139 start_codon:yes stop_codon:yes gene_type:complete
MWYKRKKKLLIYIGILICSLNIIGQTPKIIIFPDSIKNNIPLFGYNYTYANGGKNLITPDSTWNINRKNSVIDLNPGWMRFPGGTISNLYKWKNAIGHKQDRVGMNGNNFNIENNFFGPDEAGHLAEVSKSEMVVVVSINYGSRYAADWVEYMNSPIGLNLNGGVDYAQIRANNGHPLPYNVKYWEIGNEGGNSRIWQRWNEHLDPKDYGASGQYPHNNLQFRNWVVNGGDKSFYNYKAVTNNSWLDSNIKILGIPNEKRYTKIAPVMLSSIAISIGTDTNNATTWTRVNDLSTSSSNDLHYMFDETKGEIVFGNNVNGAIPTTGAFVFTDFSIEDYDGHLATYNQMKNIDSTIQIASGFSWMKSYIPFGGLDASQKHGNGDAPNTYAANTLFNNLSKVLGEYTFRYNDSHNQNEPPLFVTEIETPGRDMEAAIFFLMLYSKSSAWGDHIHMIGANYLIGDSQINQCHISHSNLGSIIQGTGLVTNLFNNHFGRQLIKSTSSNFPTQNINYYKNSWDTILYSENLEKVYSVSSINADSSKIYVLCVNNSKSDTITSSIRINSLNYSYSIDSVLILQASSPIAINSAGNPNEISISSLSIPNINNGIISDHTFPPLSATVFEINLEPISASSTLNQSNKIVIYPNPTRKVIRISGLDIKLDYLKIYDVLGKDITSQVKKTKSTNNNIVLDLSRLSFGMYYVKSKIGAYKVYKL